MAVRNLEAIIARGAAIAQAKREEQDRLDTPKRLLEGTLMDMSGDLIDAIDTLYECKNQGIVLHDEQHKYLNFWGNFTGSRQAVEVTYYPSKSIQCFFRYNFVKNESVFTYKKYSEGLCEEHRTWSHIGKDDTIDSLMLESLGKLVSDLRDFCDWVFSEVNNL